MVGLQTENEFLSKQDVVGLTRTSNYRRGFHSDCHVAILGWFARVLMVVLSLLWPSHAIGQEPFGQTPWDPWSRLPAESVVEGAPSAFPKERRIRVLPRSSVRWNADSFVSESGERVVTIDGGVNILIHNVQGFDVIDISTDRVVIWTSDDALSEFGGDNLTPTDVPFELYMEGNIVFRQGERLIHAKRMYYDVQTESGVILESEMLSPIVGYNGLVRLKADVIQQVNRNRFLGSNAGVTTSLLGVPSYWLQTGSFSFTGTDRPVVDARTGLPEIDPATGKPRTTLDGEIVSRSNSVFFGSIPVFYWPTIRTTLDKPTYYLNSLDVNNDNVFGTQVLTGWDLYQLLGINRPIPGTEWTASIDYLSKRGLGLGTEFTYDIDNFLGKPGQAYGFIDAWGINDDGFDNLGADRRQLVPEESFRGRILGRHRNVMPGGIQFSAELGFISDRNFLEQYYEREWDEQKDQTTGIELKRTVDNHSLSLSADARVNDFFTQTERLPRLDHFLIGKSILGDWLTWTEHSHVGYEHLRIADPPSNVNPSEVALFDPLAWERDAEGVRAATRHEISLPVAAGPIKFVPYALGEAAYWHEDINANDVDRLYGQAGMRASLPMWSVNPTVRDDLFNLNGMAHKVVWEAEFLFADADQNLARFPLYDQLDDDAIEAFRRRFLFTTFGCMQNENVPFRFDERSYAFRSNLQGWVTSPSTEIADDLMAFRVGANQRWQTKRGLPGREHIVDWITLNVQGFIYPNSDRDNFGQEIGLASYDFSWHPGDRFTVVSDGLVDLFSEGLRTIYLGAIVKRPGRGSYSAGIRSIEGPISSQILFSSANYRLSQKWIINYGSSYDFGNTGNLGQTGQIIRVGESFLAGLGFHYDSSRDNFGVRFAFEPRFLGGKMSRVGGVPIGPAGATGLE